MFTLLKKKNLRDEAYKKRQMELPLRIAAPIRSSTMEQKKRQLTMAHLEVSSPRYAFRNAKNGSKNQIARKLPRL